MTRPFSAMPTLAPSKGFRDTEQTPSLEGRLGMKLREDFLDRPAFQLQSMRIRMKNRIFPITFSFRRALAFHCPVRPRIPPPRNKTS